jgi:hypothetical protein
MVSSELHVPAALSSKEEPTLSVGYETGLALMPLSALRIDLAHARNQTAVIQKEGRHCTDVPTELSRLQKGRGQNVTRAWQCCAVTLRAVSGLD